MPGSGYTSSLDIPDVLSGIAPSSLAPPNMPGRWSNPNTWNLLGATLRDFSNRARTGNPELTQDAIRAHQEATARLRPFVPPRILQQIYLARLSGHYDPPTGKYAIPGLGLYPRDVSSGSPGGQMSNPPRPTISRLPIS